MFVLKTFHKQITLSVNSPNIIIHLCLKSNLPFFIWTVQSQCFCCRLENTVSFIYSTSVISCFGFGSFSCRNNKYNDEELIERSHVMELVVMAL